jgi:cytochrome P450
MAQEGFSLLTASGDTIARTMTTAIYHLLNNPDLLARLRTELALVMPGPNDQVELQNLESLAWFVSIAQLRSATTG